MQIICGSVDRVELDTAEVCRRLLVPRDFTLEKIDQCRSRLNGVMTCRYAWVRVPLSLPSNGTCVFDFAEVESKDLYRNLYGCSEAFVFAVTLGMGVDRLLCRLNLLSQAEHFITDGLASAAAEALCDSVNETIAHGLRVKPRFSPGYGDVPLSVQAPLLQRLRAESTLGITLNDAYLMTPVKSITAIAGILP